VTFPGNLSLEQWREQRDQDQLFEDELADLPHNKLAGESDLEHDLAVTKPLRILCSRPAT